MTHQHGTPRMHQRPHDPAYDMLYDGHTSQQRVHREGCYICEDREFARMGLPLCSPCCQCRAQGRDGHIAADDGQCDDCRHAMPCDACMDLPAQAEPICTCNTPCCEADVDIGIITCESAHCPTHGVPEDVEL